MRNIFRLFAAALLFVLCAASASASEPKKVYGCISIEENVGLDLKFFREGREYFVQLLPGKLGKIAARPLRKDEYESAKMREILARFNVPVEKVTSAMIFDISVFTLDVKYAAAIGFFAGKKWLNGVSVWDDHWTACPLEWPKP